MINEDDWEGLGRLFADEHAPFRHAMGLFRSSAAAFYAPTAAGTSIQAEKQAILESSAAGLHFLETGEGLTAFREFTQTIGVPDTSTTGLHALNRAATLALEPDWMLMAPGAWTLAWASVCFPTRWSLAGKAGQPLADIHAVVPGLNAELGRKIGLFFDRLIPGEGWGRANWGLSSNANRNQHPLRPYTPLSGRESFEKVYIRVEAQHLLKLPGTGAIAFGIRIHHFSLAAVAGRPGVATGLKERLRTMPPEVAAYKGIPGKFWRRF